MTEVFPLSREQYDLIKNSKALSMNLAHGPVRAGKNFAINQRLLLYLKCEPFSNPASTFVFGGTSKEAIYRNFLKDFLNLLDTRDYKYSKSTGKGQIRTASGLWRDFYCVNGKDNDSAGMIRGATVGGYHLTELTLLNQEFCEEMEARKSVSGALGFADTNADSPYHWVYKKYVENPEANDSKFVRLFEFNFDSNRSLSQDYKDGLKASYVPGTLNYRRKILNEWVLAEGVIYDNFNELENTISPEDIPPLGKYYVTCDYGASNPCVFLLIGWSYQTGKYYVVKEYYHSGKVSNEIKTNEQYAQDLKDFVGSRKLLGLFVDPSALSFKETLKRQGFGGVMRDADNSVLEGIEDVKRAYENKDLFVSKACTNYLREVSTYSWDTKASIKSGKDIPIKQNDHTQDAIRYFVRSCMYNPIFDRFSSNKYD